MALLEISGLTVCFDSATGRGETFRALDGVDLALDRGESVGLVGESGSGKTTLAKSIVRLVDPVQGSIRFDGVDLIGAESRALARIRTRIGFVMQDSASALNPRRSVLDSVAAPLAAQPEIARDHLDLARGALARVGISADLDDRRPSELSGGQRQRVGLARAIVTDPDLLICDEPLAGLDLITEATMLELFRGISGTVACLFITHDLFVAAAIGDRISVMEEGKIVEDKPAGEIIARPEHPHTRALIEAIPPTEPDPIWRDRHAIVRPVQPPFEAGV